MSDVIVDAVGKPVSVGDEVVFALGGRGAQPFVRGVVEKVNNVTISIAHNHTVINPYTALVTTTPRKSGCFVIVQRSGWK